jgi:enediyne biosynthesis protein E4
VSFISVVSGILISEVLRKFSMVTSLGRLGCVVMSSLLLGNCSSPDSRNEQLFTKLSAAETGINFVNINSESDEENILTYEYFYNGGGVAVGDINNDGLVDVYFSANQGENKLYLNKGNFKFEDITKQAGVSVKSGWCTGVAMVDINNDGYLDIYVSRSGWEHPIFRANVLLINNKDLTFTDKAAAYGLNDDSYSTQASFLDYDKDGDLDMFLLNHSRLLISNSYDVTKRYEKTRTKYVGNKLYNNNKGKYLDVSDSVGIFGPPSNYGLGVAYSDVNSDGWIDLYTSNDYTEKDKLFFNDQGKLFYDVSDSLLTHMSQFSMGVDIADINNDGWQDIVTVDMLPEENRRQKEFFWPDRYDVYATMVKNGLHHQYMRNMLQLNNGDGSFSEIGQLAGISNTDWSWAPLFADYDNDGLQDLLVTNGFKRNFTSNDFMRYQSDLVKSAKQGKEIGKLAEVLKRMPATKVHNYIFQNKDGIKFEDKSMEWGLDADILANGAAYADLDNDGDLDLVTNAMDEEAGVYRNNGEKNGNHFLKVRLQSNTNNSFALGARVTLYHSGGKLMTRTLCPYRGFQSSVEPALFFGLGRVNEIDSLHIEWPEGGVQKLSKIKTDQFIICKKNSISKKQNSFEPTLLTQKVGLINFKHQENDFIDFKIQALLPRSYSTMGPAMAMSDVNEDGLSDLYVGGSKGKSGALLLQDKQGYYCESKLAKFTKDAEETDAIFFDIDNDGDEDLYVVTGGYEFDASEKALTDRLYTNEGNGKFKSKALPEMLSSGSCVRPADIDGDGDKDLFVGGRIVPGRYPEIPLSYILINDGKGNFTIRTDEVSASLGKVGLVTDASWLDLNGDSQPDLIIVGEWMPITIYINNAGKLTDHTRSYIKEETAGWWNCILIGDFDGDTDQDFVVGNFGLNNQFKPTPEKPITLYYRDYDNNGSVDPIMNYFIGEKSYPSPTRDELTDQIPFFKKRFTNYGAYTTATIETILSDDEIATSRVHKAYRLESTYFRNDGHGFTLNALPSTVQFSPIFSLLATDINNDGKLDVVGGGNLSKMGARFGKASSSFGVVLIGNGKGGFDCLPSTKSGICIRGDIRKILIEKNNRLIFARSDNLPVIFDLTQ